MSTGWMPPFDTVNVPPARSSGVSFPSRARAARSAMRALISSIESRSAPATTGATSPESVSTATAMLISASSSIAVSVTRAFSTGCSRSAAATSFTTIAVTPIRGDAPSSFRRARSSTSGFTSISSTEVSCALSCRLETMRVAIVRRRPRSGISFETVSAARLGRRGGLPARLGPRGDVAVDDPAPGARPGDLARILEREAELSQERSGTRGDERRVRTRGLRGTLRQGWRIRRRSRPCDLRDRGRTSLADVAEERVAALVGRQPLAAPRRGSRSLWPALRTPLVSRRSRRPSRRSAQHARPGRAGGASPRSRPRPPPSSSPSLARRRPRREQPPGPRR